MVCPMPHIAYVLFNQDGETGWTWQVILTIYRLPSEYEWILAAGHMPKDVAMNSNFVESGLTPVDAYASSVGNCGGIDFWGNCWEWTSTQSANGEYIVKGGAWDSSRDSVAQNTPTTHATARKATRTSASAW